MHTFRERSDTVRQRHTHTHTHTERVSERDRHRDRDRQRERKREERERERDSPGLVRGPWHLSHLQPRHASASLVHQLYIPTHTRTRYVVQVYHRQLVSSCRLGM